MKYLILTGFFAFASSFSVSAQQYKVITIVESLSSSTVPFSKIVDSNESLNTTDGYAEFSTESEAANSGMRPSPDKAREMDKEREGMSREERAKAAARDNPTKEGKKSGKVTKYNEVALHNLGGPNGAISPGNAGSNDQIISAKMSEMAAKGWTLSHVGTVVEGEGQNRTIITRLYFFKAKK